MRIAEPFKTASGWVASTLPLHKWKRPDGLTSFLTDMVALRKTLSLCYTCEHKMPRRWEERYDYQRVRTFYADCAHCDWCRHPDSTTMWVATEGRYAQQIRDEQAAFARIRAAERLTEQRTRQYLIGA